jgi:hypothetical protein
MKKLAVCHTINPNSKTSGLFKHPLPYYKYILFYEIKIYVLHEKCSLNQVLCVKLALQDSYVVY